MNRRNYQKELDRIISKRGKRLPRVLLHSCCGPCSGAVLEYLTQYFDVTLLWYNPNIWPEAEFEKRLATLKQLVECLEKDGSKAKIMECDWRCEDYFSRVKGLENEPEEGQRCVECFRIRLEETARIAAENGFEWFCTTLTVSSRKDAVVINAIGREFAAKYGVKWLPSEFRKQEGNHRSIILSEKYGLYRQEYCGCVYSMGGKSE